MIITNRSYRFFLLICDYNSDWIDSDGNDFSKETRIILVQNTVTVPISRQLAILLVGIAITIVGFSAIGDSVTKIVTGVLMKIVNVDDVGSLYYTLVVISVPWLLGTAIVLYGFSMTLFKAPILSVKSLIFGLVSVAYLASWAAFLSWLVPIPTMG